MNRPLQKGTQVNHTTSSARTPSLRTGFFASLRGGGSGAPSDRRGVGGRTSSLRLLAPLALALAAIPAFALAALFGGRRRPRATKHQSDGGGQQLVTSTCLDLPAHRHVLGRPDSSTIGTPCVLPLLGPALAVPALGGPGSPPTAVTATTKGSIDFSGALA